MFSFIMSIFSFAWLSMVYLIKNCKCFKSNVWIISRSSMSWRASLPYFSICWIRSSGLPGPFWMLWCVEILDSVTFCLPVLSTVDLAGLCLGSSWKSQFASFILSLGSSSLPCFCLIRVSQRFGEIHKQSLKHPHSGSVLYRNPPLLPSVASVTQTSLRSLALQAGRLLASISILSTVCGTNFLHSEKLKTWEHFPMLFPFSESWLLSRILVT